MIILIFCFTFIQNIFADICDSGYKGEHYLKDLGQEYSSGISCGYSPYDNLKPNIPDTITNRIGPEGNKTIETITMIGDNCFERTHEYFDNKGKVLSFISYIEQGGSFILQITYNGIVRNISYGNTPCEFTVFESSRDSLNLHFDGTKNDPEKKKLEGKYPDIVHTFLIGQIYQCIKYKEYKEYIEFLDSLGK